jgi:hypothetical protein
MTGAAGRAVGAGNQSVALERQWLGLRLGSGSWDAARVAGDLGPEYLQETRSGVDLRGVLHSVIS